MPTYRTILRGTAIFGGTQAVTLLASLVRGKCVAILLGAHGMGISSLLTSALTPITQFFSLGLPTVAISNIAAAGDDIEERSRRVVSFRRAMTVLGMMAMAYILAVAPLLTRTTFPALTVDGHDAFWWIVMLAPAAAFMMMAQAENTILQSHHALRRLAVCNVTGPLAGIVLGVPIYWLWGTAGIAPAIMVLGAVTWGVARYHTAHIPLPSRPSWRETWLTARTTAQLGVAMMMSGMAANIVIYITNTYISTYGSTEDVGLYQTAITVTTQCTSMVFVALATDYYPHLAETIQSRIDTMRLITKEGEIAVLVTAPLAAVLIVCAPIMVRVLLTEDFLAAVPLIQTMALVFILRAYYFPLDYICLAKNDKVFYFFYEGVWCNVQNLVITIVSYRLGGLTGLAYGIVVNAALYAVLAVAISRLRYRVAYTRRMNVLAMTLIGMIAALIAVIQWQTAMDSVTRYLLATGLTAAVCCISAVKIWKRRKV